MPDGAAGYLVLAAVVFGVNLLPAFGPPTWAILVLFRVQSDLAAVPLVLVGALAAASGRLLLATAARHLRGRLSPARIDNLDVVRSAVAEGRGRAAAGLGLFACRRSRPRSCSDRDARGPRRARAGRLGRDPPARSSAGRDGSLAHMSRQARR
jgi:hypothetical protein